MPLTLPSKFLMAGRGVPFLTADGSHLVCFWWSSADGGAVVPKGLPKAEAAAMAQTAKAQTATASALYYQKQRVGETSCRAADRAGSNEP